MSESPKEINEIIDVIYLVAAIIELKYNPNKCKSLIFFSGQHNKVTFKLGSKTIPDLVKEHEINLE